MEQFVGKFISLNCGESLGVFQGQIMHVDPNTQKITLQKAFHNGCPYGSAEVTISGKDIKGLEMIEAANETAHSSGIKIKKPVAKKATSSNSNSLEQSSSNKGHELRQSPRKNFGDSDVMRTPTKKDKWKKGWRDEAAFGSPVDDYMTTEFDFQKNLALFNKKAFYDEMNASKPDVVRQTDKSASNYRCDENVLNAKPAMYRQMTVPEAGLMEYVTDTGLVIPSLSPDLRRRLFAAAERLGLTFERQSELLGRATTEMTIVLLGGAHRLNPHNHHQCPSVAVLCGSGRIGCQGVNCARQLASHGVRTTVYIQDPVQLTSEMTYELALYRLTNNKMTTNLQDLCTAPVDLIILALADSTMSVRSTPSPAAKWANENRAQVLVLDPPPSGTPGVTCKFSLVPGLPLAYGPSNGKVYLCNIGIPMQIFKDLSIKYVPPFGPKFVLPLYPNDL